MFNFKKLTLIRFMNAITYHVNMLYTYVCMYMYVQASPWIKSTNVYREPTKSEALCEALGNTNRFGWDTLTATLKILKD